MKRCLCVIASLLFFACPPPADMDGGSAGGRAGGHGGGAHAGGAGGGVAGGAGGASGGTAGGGTAGGSVMPRPDGGWCEQPGAWVHDDAGYHQVGLPDGGAGPGNLRWMQLPVGFCAHPFATVGYARELRFAPSGELFVASPTMGTTSSGGAGGLAAIVLLPDDDGDGLADGVITWRGSLPATQGLAFADGGFYFQDDTHIMREPYVPGQRAPSSAPVQVANITVFTDVGHWPKTIDIADDGTVYVTNGGTQGETCDPTRPFHGGVLAIDGTVGGRLVARGLRNPIYLRCHHDGHDLCFANELARDYSSNVNGREKLINVHAGDDWGYPCCASQNLPYSDVCLTCSALTDTLGNSLPVCSGISQCSPKCDQTKAESGSFIIGDTPFGLDFMDGQFPPPWDHRVYVAVHGAFGTWQGARVTGIAYDPTTGVPYGGTNLPGVDAGTMVDFLTGWDDGAHMHGRPTDLTVSPDGRIFVSNDQNGEIFWVAPVQP